MPSHNGRSAGHGLHADLIAPKRRSVRSGLATAGMLLGIVALAAACTSGGGLGYATPPAALDPNSPTLKATNVAFDHRQIPVAANAPFILVFENEDAFGHNVSIYRDAAYQQQVFQGAIFSGLSTRWYPVPALAPGSYAFRCDLHPNMTGQIVAS